MDLTKIQSQLESAKSEIEQLKSGRKVSSSRARSALMKIKKESDIIRKEILTHSKNLPVKQRKTRVDVSPAGLNPVGLSPVVDKPNEILDKPPMETTEAPPKQDNLNVRKATRKVKK